MDGSLLFFVERGFREAFSGGLAPVILYVLPGDSEMHWPLPSNDHPFTGSERGLDDAARAPHRNAHTYLGASRVPNHYSVRRSEYLELAESCYVRP